MIISVRKTLYPFEITLKTLSVMVIMERIMEKYIIQKEQLLVLDNEHELNQVGIMKLSRFFSFPQAPVESFE